MTSPVRKRRDRSRRRLSLNESLEVIRAKQIINLHLTGVGSGATSAPLTRADIGLISRAVREGWDVPSEKRVSILRQLDQTIAGDDDRLVICAAQLVMRMHPVPSAAGDVPRAEVGGGRTGRRIE